MATVQQTFEGGTNGAPITATDVSVAGDESFDLVHLGTDATAVYSNTHTAHGGMAAQFTSSATQASAHVDWNTTSFPGVNELYGRCYVYLTAFPTAVLRLWDAVGLGALIVGTNGKITVQVPTGLNRSTSANTIPLNQWVRIEWHCVFSATDARSELRVYADPDSYTPSDSGALQTGIAGTAGPSTSQRWGMVAGTSNVGPFWLDDVKLDTANWVGPTPVPATVTGVTAGATGVALGSTVGTSFAATGAVASASASVPAGTVTIASVAFPVTMQGTTAGLTGAAPAGSADFPHIFRTPLIKLGPMANNSRLWLYYGIETGISVLKNHDGTYTQVQMPTEDQVAAAAIAYIGGHEYTVSAEEWASLQAAGYGDGTYVPPDNPPPPVEPGGETPPPVGPADDPLTYGGGPYGSGRYGF